MTMVSPGWFLLDTLRVTLAASSNCKAAFGFTKAITSFHATLPDCGVDCTTNDDSWGNGVGWQDGGGVSWRDSGDVG